MGYLMTAEQDPVTLFYGKKGRFLLTYIDIYSRTPVTRTLKGSEKQFELAGGSSYRGRLNI